MKEPTTRARQLDRRLVLQRLAAWGFAVPAAVFLSACAAEESSRDSSGMSGPMMGDGMMGEGMMMDPATMAEMHTIHDLLAGHDSIRRTVQDIDGGIRSVTISDDQRLAGLIAGHVEAMKRRVEQGRPIRQMDPLFREIFRHHRAIVIEIAPLPGGVQVTETSTDRNVELLIRQHARAAVSQFVAIGMPRAMQPTPLPEGYQP